MTQLVIKQQKLLKLVFSLVLALVFTACEKAVITTEPVQVRQTEQLPKDIKFRISYNEKTFTTSTQWPESIIGGDKTTSDEELLVDFQNVKTIIELDTSGYFSTEVEFIEGNADTHMPMELYSSIESKVNPPHANANPMARYTILNGIYTAYGIDGSEIFTGQVPNEKISDLIDTSLVHIGGNPKIGLVPTNVINSTPLDQIVSDYQMHGIQCSIIGDGYLKLERNIATPSGNVRTKSIINARTGLLERNALYNTEGKLLSVLLNTYKDVDGYFFPATTVNYAMDYLSDGSWGISTKTVKTRSEIKILVND